MGGSGELFDRREERGRGECRDLLPLLLLLVLEPLLSLSLWYEVLSTEMYVCVLYPELRCV